MWEENPMGMSIKVSYRRVCLLFMIFGGFLLGVSFIETEKKKGKKKNHRTKKTTRTVISNIKRLQTN
jgi:CHASE3 domain sensor protein